MDDFLTKPVDPQALSASLRRWLGDGPTAARRTALRPAGRGTTSPLPDVHRDPADPQERPDLDLDRIRMLRDLVPGSTAYLDRAIDNFLQNSPVTEATLQQAWADDDPETLGFHVHSLKGNAANLGLVRVAEIAELLQRTADSGDLDGAEVLLTQLTDLLHRGREALRLQRVTAYADLARA